MLSPSGLQHPAMPRMPYAEHTPVWAYCPGININRNRFILKNVWVRSINYAHLIASLDITQHIISSILSCFVLVVFRLFVVYLSRLLSPHVQNEESSSYLFRFCPVLLSPSTSCNDSCKKGISKRQNFCILVFCCVYYIMLLLYIIQYDYIIHIQKYLLYDCIIDTKTSII